MNKAITVKANKLEYSNFSMPKLQPHSVMIEQKAFGINHDDIEVISGLIQNSNKYGILGVEASGIVTQVSSDCTLGFAEGDRVCYATTTPGAFIKYRSVLEECLIPLPKYISFEFGATILKGILAYTLLGKVFTIQKNAVILVSGASGGVGSILIELASKAGMVVIALTSNDDKKGYLKSKGAFEAINYKKQKVNEEILALTHGMGVDFFFDCLGKEVEDFAFDVIKSKGFFISFGTITGEPTKISFANQREKSITTSRVVIDNFIRNRNDLIQTSIAYFKSIQGNFIQPNLNVYNFLDASATFKQIAKKTPTGQKLFLV
jgi:NADPH2:quinone reductase